MSVATSSDESVPSAREVALSAVGDLEERIKQHVARELHDSLAQTLTVMLVQIENFKREQAGRASVLTGLDQLQTQTRELLGNLRQMVVDLRADTSLPEVDLIQAVAAIARRFEDRTDLRVEIDCSPSWSATMGADRAMHLLRIIEEGLTNAHRHSGATVVKVAMSQTDEYRVLRIQDNGRGADFLVDGRFGFGLRGIQERVLMLGGDLSLDSVSGAGTGLQVVMPLEIGR